MGNELITVDVREVTIPTEKLNTVQQKQYKDYGLRTLDEIEGMTRELMDAEFREFREKNETQLWDDLEKKNPKIAKHLAAYTSKKVSYESLVDTRKKEVGQVDIEIQKLASRKENILSGYTKKVKDIYFSVKKDIEAIENSKIVGKGNFRLELDEREQDRSEYFTTISDFKDRRFKEIVEDKEVSTKLNEMFDRKTKDMTLLKESIKELRENLEEVMLFDDKKIKPLFENILRIKQTVKAKYRQKFLS